MPRKLKNNNLAEQAYSILKRDIQNGVFVPEQRLVEKTLSESMAVSRTPIRQALQRLEAEMYLERASQGGYQVRRLTREDILHLYCIRIELEDLAITWAAEKCTEPGLQEMEKCMRKMEEYGERGDMAKVAVHNSLFHRAIGTMSGSIILVELIDSLKDRTHRAIYKGLNARDAFSSTVREHWEIIEAMRRKDVEMARSLLRAHLQRSMDAVLSQV